MLICFCWWMTMAGFASSQTSDILSLKGVFIERFIRFIEYPQVDCNNEKDLINHEKNFIIAVAGQIQFEKKLRELYQERNIGNCAVKILHLQETDDPIPDCHVLFVGSVSQELFNRILEFSAKHSVLTISHTKGFAQQGIHINFVMKDSRLRFEINHQALLESDLKANYMLLKFADRIFNQQHNQQTE